MISVSQLQELWLERQPSFIPLTNSNPDVKKLHDKRTNIIHHRLSNGISIIYKDISCLGDLASLYKAVTMEDIYLAYDHLKISDDSIYSCIGNSKIQILVSAVIKGLFVTIATHPRVVLSFFVRKPNDEVRKIKTMEKFTKSK
ncbi:hypothetical protein L484_019024 [Morus notabilis]|uniref:Uncharacterized protein n=1 Tax=Morus notabilis TaxID=981085 RepID=W9R4P3_9ROSA|nr:hypothetical protein L484_019024 [Morus notabilis]